MDSKDINSLLNHFYSKINLIYDIIPIYKAMKTYHLQEDEKNIPDLNYLLGEFICHHFNCFFC